MSQVYGPTLSHNPDQFGSPRRDTPREESEKKTLLRNEYAGILLSRIAKASGITYILNIGFMIGILSLARILHISATFPNGKSQPGDESGEDLEHVLPHLFTSMFRDIGKAVISPTLMWIFFLCCGQCWILSICATSSWKYFPTNRTEVVYWIMGGRRFPTLWACCIAMGLLNALMTHFYMKMVGAGMIELDSTAKCRYLLGLSEVCWNQQYKFICLISFVSGYLMYAKDYFDCSFTLNFSHLGINIVDYLRQSIFEAMYEMRSFFRGGCLALFCLFTVNWFSQRIYFLTSAEYDDLALGPDLTVWFHLLAWPLMTLFFMKLAWKIVNVVNTEVLDLPVESSIRSDNIILLSDAMNYGCLSMKCLGFYEFMMLTSHPKHKGKMLSFFNLSHPGGHPKNWEGVLKATLRECNDLTEKLTNYVANRPPRRPQPTDKSKAVQSNSNDKHSKSHTATLLPNLPNNDQQPRRRNLTVMRDLTYAEQVPTLISEPTFGRVFFRSPYIFFRGTKRLLSERLTKLYSWLKSLVFGVCAPDTKYYNYKLTKLVSKSGLLIKWGLHGVSEIACASIEHDRHGIVQRDLKQIIQTSFRLFSILNEVSWDATLESLDSRVVKGRRVDTLSSNMCYYMARIHESFVSYYDVLGIPQKYREGMETMSEFTLGTSAKMNY